MEKRSNIILALILIFLLSITFLIVKFIRIEQQQFENRIFIFIALAEIILFLFILLNKNLKVEKLIFNTVSIIMLFFNLISTILLGIFHNLFTTVIQYSLFNIIIFLVSISVILISYLVSYRGSENKC